MFSETAPAKINLNLHVGPLIEDSAHSYFGYHPLSSVVAFADIGDKVSCKESSQTYLKITGPFSEGLEVDDRNLIMKAYHAVTKRASLPPLNFYLEKNLPIASGIGGGSSDAAAALRLLKNYAHLSHETWHEIAYELGADVPVCFDVKTVLMTGIGENLMPLPEFGKNQAVLINPGNPVGTGQVFKLFDQLPRMSPIDQTPLDITTSGRNDLQGPAIQLLPDIQDCLDILALQKGCNVQRMSGSGATCFGLFEEAELADTAAEEIAKQSPNWWVRKVVIGEEN